MRKLIFAICGYVLLTSCATIKRIKGNKPNCPSYNYSSFMGKTKDWVIAQNIKDPYVFLEYGIENGPRTDTKIAFNIENGLVSGVGCY